MAVRLRRGTLDDAAWLAAFRARTFREAYAHLMSAEEIAQYGGRAFHEAVQREELVRPGSVVLMAVEDDERLGFCWLHADPVDEVPSCVTGPGAVNLARLYVEPTRQSQGIGARLVEGAIAEARGLGGEMLWLQVWEKNPRAVAFYRRMGFTEIGRAGFPTDPDPECDLVMARWLGACS
jgi:ribosomal protein S18 acetylase RimI-like enzyme